MNVTLNMVCHRCHEAYELKEVPVLGLWLWRQAGLKIQDAMPDLSADEREMLLSGLCPTCFELVTAVAP